MGMQNPNSQSSSGQPTNTPQSIQHSRRWEWHGFTLGELTIGLFLYGFCFIACYIGFRNPGNVLAAIFASFGVCVGVFVSNSSFTNLNNAVYLFLVISLDNFLSSPPPGIFPRFFMGMAILQKLTLVLVLALVLARLIASRPLTPTSYSRAPKSRCYHTQIIPISPSIGLSDGCFAFDTMRTDGALKEQVAIFLKEGKTSEAESLLQHAQQEDPSDAEAHIYLADQKVLESGRPYVTFIIAAPMTGPYADLGRYDLQVAYLAQKNYNADRTHKIGLQLLVANTGGQESQCGQMNYAEQVAQLIAQEAKKDHSIVAIMGSPIGDESATIMKTLQNNNIMLPMISTAPDDGLASISDYLYSIAPSNSEQAMAMFRYAQLLHAKTAYLFLDECDSYSDNLAIDIQKAFDNAIAIKPIPYEVSKPETIQAGLQAVLKEKPGIIVFAGRANEVNVLLNDSALPITGGPSILGGSALYEVGEYKDKASTRFPSLHFVSPAYPDEWSVLDHQKEMPAFFREYAQVFDPDGVHTLQPYGYSRPTAESMLAYDAMNLLFHVGGSDFTAESMLSGLKHTMGSQAWPGVTGSIAFKLENDHELQDKTILFLRVDPNGNIQMLLPKGRYAS